MATGLSPYKYWLHQGSVADVAVFFAIYIYTRICVFYAYIYTPIYSYIYYFLLIVNNRQHWQQIAFKIDNNYIKRVADFVATRVAVADFLTYIKVHRCIDVYKNYFDKHQYIKIS